MFLLFQDLVRITSAFFVAVAFAEVAVSVIMVEAHFPTAKAFPIRIIVLIALNIRIFCSGKVFRHLGVAEEHLLMAIFVGVNWTDFVILNVGIFHRVFNWIGGCYLLIFLLLILSCDNLKFHLLLQAAAVIVICSLLVIGIQRHITITANQTLSWRLKRSQNLSVFNRTQFHMIL